MMCLFFILLLKSVQAGEDDDIRETGVAAFAYVDENTDLFSDFTSILVRRRLTSSLALFLPTGTQIARHFEHLGVRTTCSALGFVLKMAADAAMVLTRGNPKRFLYSGPPLRGNEQLSSEILLATQCYALNPSAAKRCAFFCFF